MFGGKGRRGSEAGGTNRNSGKILKRLRTQATVVRKQKTGNPHRYAIEAGKN
jgi:hypothetical protein